MRSSRVQLRASSYAPRVLSRILSYTGKYKARLTLAFIALLLSTFLSLAIPRFLGEAIDLVLEQGSFRQVALLALGILIISLFRGIFAYGQSYLGEWVAQRVAYDLRNAFYERLQRLSFAYHDREHTGDLMSKATTDVENIRWFISFGLIRSAYLLVLLTTASFLLFSINWQLALVSLSFLPVVALRSVWVSRALRHLWLKVHSTTGELTTVLQENLSGIRVVKAFAAEDRERSKFDSKAAQVAQETLRVNRLHASNSSLMHLIFTLAVGLILWYGGREVIRGDLSPGGLAQFIFYMGMLAWPVRMVGWLVNIFSRAASSGQRIFQVLDAESAVEERPGAQEVGRLRGHVCFEGVSFSYDSALPALKGVTLEARPGQVIALVGEPGSGKSTLVHLLPRFYEVTEGRITIDGIDIRDMTLASLRRNIGMVFQDVFLFSATIRENISYGRPGASLSEVVQAAKAAQLHEFILSLPQGYDTWVGERGITLSGGQRQRLAIARTILLDPPVLILDDSTSSVDMETEHLIYQALEGLMRGRTTFVIAHRLATLRRADLILVLKNGEIVERGKHQELLARGTLYRQIYELQLGQERLVAKSSRS